MSITDCENVQAALAESDLRHISQELATHVQVCPDCAAYLNRLQHLQDDLADAGGGTAPDDVLDHLVQTTLQNISAQPSREASVKNPFAARTKWASGFAALFMCLGVVALLQQHYPSLEQSGLLSGGFRDSRFESKPGKTIVPDKTRVMSDEEFETEAQPKNNLASASLAEPDEELADRPVKPMKKKEARKPRPALRLEVPPAESSSAVQSEKKLSLAFRSSDLEAIADISDKISPQSGRLSAATIQSPATTIVPRRQVGADAFAMREKLGQSRSGPLSQAISRGSELQRGQKDKPVAPPATKRFNQNKTPLPEEEAVAETDKGQVANRTKTQNAQAQQIAAEFLSEYNRTDHLSFQPANGYWANTYLPGDPNMRLLQARLESWDRSGMTPVLHGDVSLEKTANAFHQPFDPPSNAALAVYLHSDHSAVHGPTRMRVQVGLQATERFGAHRPAMNLGIVVDATNLDTDTLASVKALLRAMAQAVQPGDRFSLTVAGNQGGVWINPREFRLGHVQVALDRLLKTRENPGAAATTSLLDALRAATDVVQQYDDPGAVLGSSSILLITAASLSQHIETLEALAHRNATNGITMSVFPLGGVISIEDVDRLVLNGQGQRRILRNPEEATRLVSAELLASSRAVARAVRLRIRLSPNVKLVKVLGSYRLDEPHAQRVREAERSIDRRLSKNLGIAADRGEDEEGIQIVIPSFFAGDSHAILLDVLAEGSGSIADVTVRYKDLLYLRNEVARANLSLPMGKNQPGALESQVTKNLLGLTLSQDAGRAGDLLAQGNTAAAAETLQYVLNLYKGMRHIMPNWREDQELIHDETLLSHYLVLLRSADFTDQASYVADSLRLSGYRKLLTATVTNKSRQTP